MHGRFFCKVLVQRCLPQPLRTLMVAHRSHQWETASLLSVEWKSSSIISPVPFTTEVEQIAEERMLYLTLVSSSCQRCLCWQQMHFEKSSPSTAPLLWCQMNLPSALPPALPTKTAALYCKSRTPTKKQGKI